MSLFFVVWHRCLVAVGVALAALAPAIAAADVAEPLARFSNGETISKQDLDAYVGRRLDLRGVVRNFWGAESVVKEMALTRTLVLEGERLGEKRVGDRNADRFDDIYGHAVYQKLARSCERPADATAARKYFDDHPDAFRIPPSARLTRVMLPANEKVDGETAMAWLMEQAQAVASNKATVQSIVDRATKVYKLEPQGDIGWALLDGDNLVIRALAGAKSGELLGPVREGDFAYLYHIVSKREGRQMTWAEAATSAPARVFSHCREQANQNLRDDMFRKYGVKIDEKAVRSLFSSVDSRKR